MISEWNLWNLYELMHSTYLFLLSLIFARHCVQLYDRIVIPSIT
jgi:hypothetical protein